MKFRQTNRNAGDVRNQIDDAMTPIRRDKFAAAALTGILIGYLQANEEWPADEKAARWAYEYADAMLLERSKVKQPKALASDSQDAPPGVSPSPTPTCTDPELPL